MVIDALILSKKSGVSLLQSSPQLSILNRWNPVNQQICRIFIYDYDTMAYLSISACSNGSIGHHTYHLIKLNPNEGFHNFFTRLASISAQQNDYNPRGIGSNFA
jgi:hypothetical protein